MAPTAARVVNWSAGARLESTTSKVSTSATHARTRLRTCGSPLRFCLCLSLWPFSEPVSVLADTRNDQALTVDALHDGNDVHNHEDESDNRREDGDDTTQERTEHEREDLEGHPENELRNREHQAELRMTPNHSVLFL